MLTLEALCKAAHWLHLPSALNVRQLQSASPLLQVSINMLRYGLGRSQSVPLQLGLAAAIRAAATTSPATTVAAVDFMRYTESHLAEAMAERRSSTADRCTVGHAFVVAAV